MENHSNTVLLPIAYLPSASWFYFLINSENIRIEQFETYPKQTYRNRSKILSGNGILDLTIPVSKPNGSRTLTRDIEIFGDKKWQQNHWRAICTAYLNSPYFEYYRDEFENFYQIKQKTLLGLNLQLISTVNEIIGVEKEIKLTGEYTQTPKNEIDLRTTHNPKKKIDSFIFPEYIQVFSTKFSFVQDLSILDLLFNLGPETLTYLKSIQKK